MVRAMDLLANESRRLLVYLTNSLLFERILLLPIEAMPQSSIIPFIFYRESLQFVIKSVSTGAVEARACWQSFYAV